jgi:hypothetical protein
MRHLLAASVLAIAIPSFSGAQVPAARQITVQQLEDIVADQHTAPDKKAAEKLDGLELSERLSAGHFERLNDALPGPESRQNLRIIADSAEFLDLPAQDLLPNPMPDQNTLRKILTRAADFVASSMTKMPNFNATRTAIRYRDYTPAAWPMPLIVTPGTYHFFDNVQTKVRYENGKEEIEPVSVKKGKAASEEPTGASNLGLFGPLLGVVMADSVRSRIKWGHWEQGASGPLAVFRFSVTKGNSHYSVQYCCAPNHGAVSFQPPYHGEVAVDPGTGAVLRLAVETNTQSTGVFSRADVLIEYGEVQIGPKKYICPLRSTSTTTQALFDRVSGGDEYQFPRFDPRKVTWVNEVAFTNYHVFATEIRILPDGGSTP